MVNHNLTIENANIGRGGFRNFAGEKTMYSPEGKRTFTILLDEFQAQALEEEGWHIRWREPRDEQDDRIGLLTVEVKFGKYPPKIMLISDGNKTMLDETNVAILDTAEIACADLVIRPYNWEVRGESGTKAYLQAMYVTLAEDDFGGKYAEF